MTAQYTFMITAPVQPGRLQPLRELLASMNNAPGLADPANPLLPFGQLRQLHVARFTLLEARTNDDLLDFGVVPGEWPVSLCFIGDVDGDPGRFLAELVIRAEDGLRRIFGHCQGFIDPDGDLLQWLLANNLRPTANYVNWRGRTVEQVHEEQALHLALKHRVAELQAQHPRLPARELRRRLQRFVQQQQEQQHLRLSEPQPAPAGWHLRNLAHLLGVPAALLLLSPLMLLAAPFYAYALRRQEDSDPYNEERPDPEHLQRLTLQEDLDVSNHFNVFGQVKPGRLRLITIRLGLLLLDYTSRHIYKRGYLTRVQTIHFARWVLLDDNRRVYFASNYDGSADSYMDDFINKVAWGLNLVFSNGVGYPPTRWLLHGGARHEQLYKRTLRRNQLPSESWYKAYPGLSAFDLARNTRIRQGLQARRMSDRQLRKWLTLF